MLPTRQQADPLDTAVLRRRVLDAWAAARARFREDANAEEDLVRGAYRDRLVVELAQNAADAAVAAGVPGRLLLRLRDGVLTAANVGAPLDAAGVEGLATLRASAKRDTDGAAVGRFGVGFAAVLAITDAPAVRSRDGGVRWSLDSARAAATQLPALADELHRRDGHVPVLRLPEPDDTPPPAGWDTEVVLPLRDAAAERLVRTLLEDVGPALLLSLPALAEVIVATDGRERRLTATRRDAELVVDDSGSETRWRLTTRSGRLDPALLHDRPTEERARRAWTVTWAVPLDEGDLPSRLPRMVPAVVHAPTPTDEPLDLPALLLATFPLDPGRRHVAPGPLTDYLVEQAAQAYASALGELAPRGAAVLAGVPGPVPAGVLDAALRRAIPAELAETPLLRGAGVQGDQRLLRPRDAVVLTGAGGAAHPDVLAEVVDGLVDPRWARADAMRALGVRQLPLVDLIEQLADLRRDPAGWHKLYVALDGADREALAVLPVPLVDGRLVRGPRTTLLLDDPSDAAELEPLGLRLVHPDAAHPLLERLGALRATPRALLADPAVAARVTAGEPDDGPALAHAVLGLVAKSGLSAVEQPWLGDLLLTDEDGDVAPARELVLPGGLAEQLLDPDALARPAPDLVERWGRDVLAAVGVLDGLGVVRDGDAVLDIASFDHDLPDEWDWVADVLARVPASDVPPVVPEFEAVRDLDLVVPSAWPVALAALAVPPLRRTVVEPARVLLGDGQRYDVPSYTSWWLQRAPLVDGRRPDEVRLAGRDPLLAGLWDEAELAVDDAFAAAIGVRTTLDALLADSAGADALLERFADLDRIVPRRTLRAVYAALSAVPTDRVEPPDQVRAVLNGELVVADAADAVIVDAPDLLPLLAGVPMVLVPPERAAALAEVLALPLASEAVQADITSAGQRAPVPDPVFSVLPDVPDTYVEHGTLLVGGLEVDWRVVDGTVHAATVDGLARGLAWVTGRWPLRHLVAEALHDPNRLPELLDELDLDGSDIPE